MGTFCSNGDILTEEDRGSQIFNFNCLFIFTFYIKLERQGLQADLDVLQDMAFMVRGGLVIDTVYR